jgi:hypothetical protein
MKASCDVAPIPHSPFPIPHLRRGISLLEVLISIFLMAVGLLSIASLLPVGGYQTQKASIDDRKSVIGQNAFHEFRTRGMSDPGTPNVPRWVHFLDPSRPGGTSIFGGSGNRLHRSLEDYAPLSVAIDPYGLTNSSTGGVTSKLFPRLPNGVTTDDRLPRMPRVGLSFVPSADIAERTFVAHDDTVFEKHPSDPDSPAVSKWQMDATGNNFLRRQFEGNFSWLVTLTPAYFQAVPAPTTQYNVSIAIFYKRSLNARTTTDGTEVERMVRIREGANGVDLAGFGLGGGELVLEGDQSQSHAVNAANSSVRSGQWIMVCGRYGNSNNSPAYFRWYRVVTVGQYDNSTTPGQRPITVAGPDWIGVTDQNNPANWRCKPTHIAIFEGCVGLFEKTVHLEGPSLWGY